jgi:uncharacterized SAM-binding protein YcdF (DUF218 family)
MKTFAPQKLYFFFLATSVLIFSSCALFRPSPSKLFKKALAQKPFDVIIVPGVPYNGESMQMEMRGRVIWADYLIEKGIANYVIFSGGAVYSPYIESRVMALYAQALGTPKEKIITEEKAEHSTENIYNSYWLAKNMGFKKIAVATDPFQSSLLMGFTKRRFMLPIAHIPFVIDTLSKIHNVSPTIDASWAKVENFKSIIETQSKRYRFRGTRGKNIKFEKE